MGNRNRVIFNAGKEHFEIIHPRHGEGEDFKLLGCLMDVTLTMESGIDHTLAKARAKINAMIRTRAHYSTEK